METSMAQRDQGKQWYLAVGERSIGPLTTELVVRGIRSGKVPTTAWACQVGATQWSAISSFSEFENAIVAPAQHSGPAALQQSERPRYGRSPFGLSPADASSVGDDALGGAPSSVMPAAAGVESASHSEDYEFGADGPLREAYREPAVNETEDCSSSEVPEHHTHELGADQPLLLPYERLDVEPLQALASQSNAALEASTFEFATSADVILGSSYVAASGTAAGLPGFSLDEPLDGEEPGAVDVGAHHDDLAIEITFDEAHEGAINWLERFQSYFLVGTDVELPEEEQLLRSLRETPHHVFLHDEALWNLALCLAFGSDDVARSSAVTFFEAISPEHRDERIEWICRTLLSKGFMPSGIPRCDGMRGIDMLRMACPAELRYVLEREAVD